MINNFYDFWKQYDASGKTKKQIALDTWDACVNNHPVSSQLKNQPVMQKPAETDGKDIVLYERALKLIERARELGLTEEQKHIETEDSPEKEYWHYGYAVALLDTYNNFKLKEIKKGT